MISYHRRKFGSQASDNMDRWKAEVGRVREEKRRRKKNRKEKESEDRRCSCAKRFEKVEKSQITVFFQWFVAPEGRKVGSLKRQVRSHLSRWEIKKRRGAKHISKSKCTKHTIFGALLEVEMSKKRTPLWREARFEINMLKKNMFGPLLEVEMLKKCTPLWHEARFKVKMHKTDNSEHFWKLRCRKSARRCGGKHVSKSTC